MRRRYFGNKYGCYDNWKLDNPYDNEVESFETEKFGYWSMNEMDVREFDEKIREYKGDDVEAYAEDLSDNYGFSTSYKGSISG